MNRPHGPTDLKRLHREWRRATANRLAIILDSVQNPYNIGSIVRTAAAQRVDRLYVCGKAPAVTDTKVQKTALGCHRFVDTLDDLAIDEAINDVRAAGYTVVGVELASGAEPLHALPLDRDVALVVGHEDRGIKAETLALVDAVGYIPQLGKVGSLNVATAAAIAMYECRRAEWSAATTE